MPSGYTLDEHLRRSCRLSLPQGATVTQAKCCAPRWDCWKSVSASWRRWTPPSTRHGHIKASHVHELDDVCNELEAELAGSS